MKHIIEDDDYISIVNYILNKKEFKRLKEEKHHGVNRYEHCLRVSYNSYKIAKALKLDYESTAIAGLLHDYFLDDEISKNRVRTWQVHPKHAAKKAHEHFAINEMEYDIIETHMFPVTVRPPRYIEGWIVILADDFASFGERIRTNRYLPIALEMAFIIFTSI